MKGTNPLRASRKKRFGNDPFASGFQSTSKSPEDSPKKKAKKKGVTGLDKESNERLKTMENKIDILRKDAFNEINRL